MLFRLAILKSENDLFAYTLNILPNKEPLGQRVLLCWRKGIVDYWGHLISAGGCFS